MNTILRKALETVRNHTASIQDEIRKLEAERERLYREQDILRSAPRTRDEVVADIVRMVDIFQDEYARRLVAKVRGGIGEPSGWLRPGFRLSSPMVELQAPRINLFALQRKSESTEENSLYFECLIGLLADAIKPAVRGMLEKVDWPNDAVPMEKRQLRLAEIERNINDLTPKISALLSEAREAGLDI